MVERSPAAAQSASRPAAAAAAVSPAEAEASPESDPRAYLERVAAQCAGLSCYTLTFTRTERRGLLIQRLQGPEKILCWFRREPFSIRMKWIEPADIKYGESTYVEGQEGDRVRFVPRHGFLGLAPTLTKVALATPVVWGEARRPVTDFGLEKLIARTLETLARAGERGAIRYLGQVERGVARAHHLRLEYSTDFTPTPTQDLYIDAATHLPLATEIRLADGGLDASYQYEELDASVTLADGDFVLDAERAAESRAGQME